MIKSLRVNYLGFEIYFNFLEKICETLNKFNEYELEDYPSLI
jgi:hypothetical protein